LLPQAQKHSIDTTSIRLQRYVVSQLAHLTGEHQVTASLTLPAVVLTKRVAALSCWLAAAYHPVAAAAALPLHLLLLLQHSLQNTCTAAAATAAAAGARAW
jgi:hypothetical protein